jgi:hypothetical protein
LVFRVWAGPDGSWTSRRLAGRAGARLHQLGQKGLIVVAVRGCLATTQWWATQQMDYNIGIAGTWLGKGLMLAGQRGYEVPASGGVE